MRILMLNNEFPPLGGGMGMVNFALLKQFAYEPIHDIDLITASANSRYIEETIGDNIRIFRVPIGVKNPHHATNRELIKYFVHALWFSQKHHRKNQYELCFAWSGVPAGGVAYVLNQFFGLPYLVRVCGPDIPGFERRYEGLYTFLTPMIRAIWNRADAVIAKCQEEVDMIRRVDPHPKTKIIQNGVAIEAFGTKLHDLKTDSIRLLCVGRLIERKGQNQLIEVTRRLKMRGIPVILDLVGTGDALDIYQEAVKKADLIDNVKFHGYVHHRKISDYYQRADVFILPSYNEGMSVATLEAMAAGLPIIVTKTGGSSELVVDGVNGYLFDWGDIDRLEKVLVDLVGNRVSLGRMGAASKARASQFSWTRAADQYIDLFEKLNPPQSIPNQVDQVISR